MLSQGKCTSLYKESTSILKLIRKAISRKGFIMKKQYFVNLLNNTVYVDTRFVKAAGQLDTEEWKLFGRLKREYSEYDFVVQDLNKSNKNTYRNLTFKRMEDYFNTLPDGQKQSALAEYEKRKLEAQCRNGAYSYVKSWFIHNFGDDYNKSSFAGEKSAAGTATVTEKEVA